MSTPLSLVGSRRPGPCNRHQKAAIFFEIPAPPFFAPVFFDNIRRVSGCSGWVDANNSALHLLRSCFVHISMWLVNMRLRRCVSGRSHIYKRILSKNREIKLSIKIVKGRNSNDW